MKSRPSYIFLIDCFSYCISYSVELPGLQLLHQLSTGSPGFLGELLLMPIKWKRRREKKGSCSTEITRQNRDPTLTPR
jgi:hypothetical protein